MRSAQVKQHGNKTEQGRIDDQGVAVGFRVFHKEDKCPAEESEANRKKAGIGDERDVKAGRCRGAAH